MLMDEPFSAVDPVVRGQLQDEFLRLQAELGKTIVFVTHDIDEAVKLGDQVAVLAGRRPARPVRRPRPSCSPTRPTTSSPTSSAATAATGRSASAPPATCRWPERAAHRSGSAPTAAEALRDPDGWVLVVDADGAPQGWLDDGRSDRRARRSTRSCCTAAARWPRRAARCAAALDAALSSPSGRGVVVDGDGTAGRHDHRRRGARARSRPSAARAHRPTPGARARGREAANDLATCRTTLQQILEPG